MPKLPKKKKGFICTGECPHCANIIDVYKEEETITPAVKAEKKVSYRIEKSVQTTLSHTEP